MEKGKQELKYFVRIANTDLNGSKPISKSLTQIKGVGFMFANMLCSLAKIDRLKKTGYLTKEEAELLDKIIENPTKFNAPDWMFNRRRDSEDNVSKHLVTSNLDFINCLIEGGKNGFTGAGFYGTYENCIDLNPVFISSTDFRLQNTSPCIGAGVMTYRGQKIPAFDFEGNPRPNPTGSNPDLGAFEY